MRESSRFVRGIFSWIGLQQTGVVQAARAVCRNDDVAVRKDAAFAVSASSKASPAPLRFAQTRLAPASAVGFDRALCHRGQVDERLRRFPGGPSIVVATACDGGVQLDRLDVIGEPCGDIHAKGKQRPLYDCQRAPELPLRPCRGGRLSSPLGASDDPELTQSMVVLVKSLVRRVPRDIPGCGPTRRVWLHRQGCRLLREGFQKPTILCATIARRLGGGSYASARCWLRCGSDGPRAPRSAASGGLHGADLSEGACSTQRGCEPGRLLPPGRWEHVAVRGRRAFAICVLHHVEPLGEARSSARDDAVTRAGGLVLVYEHNPITLTRVVIVTGASSIAASSF